MPPASYQNLTGTKHKINNNSWIRVAKKHSCNLAASDIMLGLQAGSHVRSILAELVPGSAGNQLVKMLKPCLRLFLRLLRY